MRHAPVLTPLRPGRGAAARAPGRGAASAASIGNRQLQHWLPRPTPQPALDEARAIGALRRQLVEQQRHGPDEAAARQAEAAGAAPQPVPRAGAAASAGAGSALPAPLRAALASDHQPLPARLPQRPATGAGPALADVRLHAGPGAARAADQVGAKALTFGRHIVFGSGQYQPGNLAGQRLLAHELAHVQQQATSATPRVQADLKAYNKRITEFLPSGDPMTMTTTSLSKSAEAPALRAALADLIAAGKVREVQSSNGDISWFAAQHHKNCQLADLVSALTAAGYGDANRLARAIYDIHGESVYADRALTTTTLFWSDTTSLGKKVQAQAERSMTEWEIGQARRVFGGAIDYGQVTIADGSINAKLGSIGGYARTVGNTIYLPDGRSRDMRLLVHELTHVWQYQTIGAVYAPKAILAQATEGYEYADDGLDNEETLVKARTEGKTLTDFNLEQQGDILRDYYRALQRGEDTSAFLPFVQDIAGR